MSEVPYSIKAVFSREGEGIGLVISEERFTFSRTNRSLAAKRADDGAKTDRWRLTTK